MNKVLGALCAAAIAVSLASSSPAQATSHESVGSGASISAATAAQRPAHKFNMKQKWAREFTRYGDSDSSVYSIDHVRELQYRLNWADAMTGNVTGTFGTATRAAVKKYQKKEGLRVTGIAGHLTWAHLIHDTIRHRGAIPHICKTNGWHACYDRSMHQVTLWLDGEMRNSWLVRGGDYGIETRVGTHAVYSRDIDHVSGLFDAPMPYAQFFDGGQALHGSAFMIDPFVDHSHGCINMYIEDSRQLWRITSTKKLWVTVYGTWDKAADTGAIAD